MKFPGKPSLFVLIGILFLTLCMGQTPSTVPDPQFGPREFGWSAENQGWKKEPWTADETPYRLIRADLTQKSAAHQLTARMLREYRDAWIDSSENQADKDQDSKVLDPQEAEALFRWDYASHLLYLPTIEDATEGEASARVPLDHYEIADAYLHHPLTHSYEFDRMHLLFDMDTGDDGYDLIPVFKRFYAHNPSDLQNMHLMAMLLTSSDQSADILLSAKIADKLVKQEPQVPMNHAVFGWCHFVAYLRTLSPSDYAKASQGYKEFLRMTPPTDPFRHEAEAFLRNLKPAPAWVRSKRPSRKISGRRSSNGSGG